MNIDLLKKAYDEYVMNKPKYKKMQNYYYGETSLQQNLNLITQRYNLKPNTNFIKLFVDRETSYIANNDITYVSKTNNQQMLKDIDYYLDHWNDNANDELLKTALVFGKAYEIEYINAKGEFCGKTVSPLNGIAIEDDFNNVQYFIHVYNLKYDDGTYLDIYDSEYIYHLDNNFKTIKPPTKHIFSEVPVVVCKLLDEDKNTNYTMIKNLQDAYETVLTDAVLELEDLRNCFLVMQGAQLKKEDIPRLKQLGVLQTSDPKGTISFLTKNLNDTWLMNTLSTIQEKIFELGSHINNQDKLQSNTSSLALRTRMISLENKCKNNAKVLSEALKKRLYFLFIYLKILKNIQYDVRDVKSKIVFSIPQDDLLMANVVNTLGDRLSTSTALSLFSFVNGKSVLSTVC